MQELNLIGQKKHMLTIIERLPNKNGRTQWKYRCDCGNIGIINSSQFGRTISCGCFRSKKAKEIHTTHNKKGTRIYNIHNSMKQRCLNPKSANYSNYGGRGIKLYKEWENFENFYNWSINNGYQENLSIDRIDVNGNYEPNNCRWVTNEQQQLNKRNTPYIKFNNETHSLSEWSIITGINISTLRKRIFNYGWSIESALTTDPSLYRKGVR